MPHVLVKMYSGRTDEQKSKLAEEITKALQTALGSTLESISVAVQDVQKDDWMEQVYEPEIVANADKLFKRPGYGSLARA